MNSGLISKGKVQEEELDFCRAAGERGPEPSGMRVKGRNQSGVSLRRNLGQDCAKRPQLRSLLRSRHSYAAFLTLAGALAAGVGSFFALAFAANSALTF